MHTINSVVNVLFSHINLYFQCLVVSYVRGHGKVHHGTPRGQRKVHATSLEVAEGGVPQTLMGQREVHPRPRGGRVRCTINPEGAREGESQTPRGQREVRHTY